MPIRLAPAFVAVVLLAGCGDDPDRPVSSPPAQPPVAGAEPPGDCTEVPARGRVAATLRLDRAAARAGEELSAVLANTGGVCLTTGLAYAWERRTDGGWNAVDPPEDLAFPEIALILAPGDDHAETVQVWDHLEPGTYRLAKDVDGQAEAPTALHVASPPLAVTSP